MTRGLKNYFGNGCRIAGFQCINSGASILIRRTFLISFALRQCSILSWMAFNTAHPDQLISDANRDGWLETRGIRVLRFWNGRLRREKDVVRDTIWHTLQERVPQPMPEYCRPMRPGENRAEFSH
jgi:hypothetical protein